MSELSKEQQAEIQATFNSMASQRNAALDAVVQRDGAIALLQAKLQDLEQKLKEIMNAKPADSNPV